MSEPPTLQMIDLHCHILPGLDDGPATLEQALDMARMAVEDGVRVAVASPHFLHPVFEVSVEERDRAVLALRTALADNDIPLAIVPGAECRLHERLVTMAREQPALTLAGAGKALLVECPETMLPPGFDDVVFEALAYRIVPIWVHPERNHGVQARPEVVREYVDMGMRILVTAGSLTGKFGFRAKRVARKLLKARLVHVLASDGHNTENRPPILGEGLKRAQKLIGDEARKLVTENPAALIKIPCAPNKQ